MTQNYNESPAILFEELNEVRQQCPDYTLIYKGYADVFYRILNQNTQFLTIRFNGSYAKTSYLLKEHNASRELTKMVNDARARIRDFCNGLDVSHFNYLYDFEALCRFISLVYECEIPETLNSFFPPSRQISTKSELPKDGISTPHPEGNSQENDTEFLRLLVDRWDKEFIYGMVDGMDEQVKVSCYHLFQGKESCCWSYITDFLSENCLLNLVRPRRKGDVIIPELIIFEPDYLVNISEIAHCFQPNAIDSDNHLIRKIQPVAQSESIVLGNFAGQLLDEEINTQPGELTYADSVTKFFRQHALTMLTTEIGAGFHAEARAQKQNIHKAFAELPDAVKGYDRGKVVLEPSFFSQMLGVQGRVDLMQLDYKFLVEQKSGKSAFPWPTHPDEAPMPQEQHFVQILLYMMIMRYNFRDQYEANNRNFSCFLLYSKYPMSLCNVDWAPELMFNAIRVRNAIVAAEYRYAAKGFGILDELSPEHFRQRPVSDKLWENFLEPQIKNLLAPIRQAALLERKYFYRMMTFIANEHLLAKVGSNQREDHGLASIWLSTLEEKRQSGNIYTDLRICGFNGECQEEKGEIKSSEKAITEVTLAIDSEEKNMMSNFRVGDIVILYPYRKGTCPNACATMIIRCSVAEITPEKITLRLRAPQSNSRIFDDFDNVDNVDNFENINSTLWAIEHDFMESSFAAQYQGVRAFLNATPARRSLLLMQRPPETDADRKINGDYGAFNDLSLRVKQAKDLFLIIGPPGTGKTSYGMLNTLKEQLSEPDSAVLITSYTNRAVDEICSKLVEEDIPFVRLGSPLSSDPAYHPFLVESMVRKCRNISDLRDQIQQARVVVGTTTALSGKLDIFALKSFDLLIIDEASQILEPHLLPILCARHDGEDAVRKIVMIGDHKQLPAVVQQSPEISKVTDPDLLAINLMDCRLSLFERLLSRYGSDPAVTFMLTKQGRMHRDIAEFPNIAFYGGRLQVVPLKHQTEPTDPSPASPIHARLAFIPVLPPLHDFALSDKVNQAEADVIAGLVVQIFKENKPHFNPTETIGVIVPYRNQIATVRNTIAQYPDLSPDEAALLRDITIDTVERYQGSQRDYILFGFTIKKYYQLQFLTNNTFEENGKLIDRKLNVAMTRARKHLLLIGNPTLLSNNPLYRRLLRFIEEKTNEKSIKTSNNWP